jgi:hypothetical protein
MQSQGWRYASAGSCIISLVAVFDNRALLRVEA